MPTVQTQVADIVLWRAVEGGREGEVVTACDRDTSAYTDCQTAAGVIERLPLKTVRSVADAIVGETGSERDDALAAAELILNLIDPKTCGTGRQLRD